MTVFSVGRTPARPYATFATAQRLEGVRIGVIREYMSKKLFSKVDEESIDIVERAIDDLRKLGQQGFPAITVPAGFTTEVWDRVRDANGGTRLVGPVQARLPVGVDFVARPFDEAILFRIASAYEATTRHRRPPPDFGPLPGVP